MRSRVNRQLAGIVVVIGVVLSAGAARAWFDSGHKITASIACRMLSAEQQKALVGILRQHPRFEQDFKRVMPKDLTPELEGEWIVQQCSIWPDLARDFEGEDRKKYHRGPWHYQDLPVFLSDADKAAMESKITMNMETKVPSPIGDPDKLNALQAIALNRAIALDAKAAGPDRAVAFCWLFHLIGDMHQPCHASAMFSRGLFPNPGEGDRGGNSVKTVQRGNLHALWDGFPGSRGKVVEMKNRAVELMANPELAQAGEAAAMKLDPKGWQVESHAIAKEYVYDTEIVSFLRALEQSGAPANSKACMVSEDYLTRGGKVSERRVVEAGYRIGKVVGELQSSD